MKKRLFLLFLLFIGFSLVHSQTYFPKNKKEDKNGIMDDKYWNLWNPKVQAKIDDNINKYRKADAVLDLSGIDKGTTVSIEQVSHDFIFGAHIFNFNQLGSHDRNEKYKALYGTLFNSATVAFYWKTFETEPNRLRFVEEYWDTEDYWNNCPNPKEQPHWRRPSTDVVVDFCEKKGIRVHGHPLIWGNRKWHNPDWIMGSMMSESEKKEMESMIVEYGNMQNYKDYETFNDTYNNMSYLELEKKFPLYTKTLNEIFKKRITDIAKHYKGRISSWDVVNESAIDYERGVLIPGSNLCKSRYGVMPGDYVFKAFKTAQEAFPENVKLNINDYNMRQCYVDQVNDMLKRGSKIDIMGSQMHLFKPQQCIDISKGKEIQTPEQILEWSGRFSATGLPIHLSEITITSPSLDEKGQQIQAIITRNLYRMWFSIKNMMGITWWNVVDDCGAPGEPSMSGLFDRNMNPKISYYAMNELINNEWKTNISLKVGKDKNYKFRGFKGKYKVTYSDKNGKKVEKYFYLKNDGDGIK